ncbi:hypothetical protein OPV22_006531 [Ensete ventricosum]|uniref:Uncharacterized protein n=1 Tax=Ensete ventricosum TaxID=4639 RepID=A0AAV8RF94_ENSVE|nr:hypothetical protein OPV22_006531 [Ensete ventricosum]
MASTSKVPLLPRHTHEIGESSSSRDSPTAGASTFQAQIVARQEEIRRLILQIQKIEHRMYMRIHCKDWYPVRPLSPPRPSASVLELNLLWSLQEERRDNEERLWDCKNNKAQLTSRTSKLIKQTEESKAMVSALASKIDLLRRIKPTEPQVHDPETRQKTKKED